MLLRLFVSGSRYSVKAFPTLPYFCSGRHGLYRTKWYRQPLPKGSANAMLHIANSMRCHMHAECIVSSIPLGPTIYSVFVPIRFQVGVINEGSTIVMKAINVNSVSMLKKAQAVPPQYQCLTPPRCVCFTYSLLVDVEESGSSAA